jgi:crossover junction endodeoxyribonuclease RusA
MNADPLEIDVGFPAHELSPNARVHRMVEHRFKKAAKIEAGWATKIAMPVNWAPAGDKAKVHLVCHLAKGAKQWDEDNLVAAVKAHLDGIAEIIGINDRNFAAPTVEWAERTNGRGKMIVRIS